MDRDGDLMPRVILKAIVPKTNKLVDDTKLKTELISALSKTGDIIQKDFRKTTRTWSTKPTFKKTGVKKSSDRLAIEIFADNEIYYYIVRGTREHPVAPVRARALRFRAGYKSKSRVGIIGSRAGGPFGPTRFSKGHMVSGIKARNFDETIAKRRQKTIDGQVRLAINRSVRVKVS